MTLQAALDRITAGAFHPGDMWTTIEGVVISFLAGTLDIQEDADIILVRLKQD